MEKKSKTKVVRVYMCDHFEKVNYFIAGIMSAKKWATCSDFDNTLNANISEKAKVASWATNAQRR